MLSEPAGRALRAAERRILARGDELPQVFHWLDLSMPITGRCSCPPTERSRHDVGSTAKHQVSCLACGAHWYESTAADTYGREVDGPPFVPYAFVLWRGGVRPASFEALAARAKRHASTVTRLRRYHWWRNPLLNPLAHGVDFAAWASTPALDGQASEWYALAVYEQDYRAGSEQALFDCLRHVPSALEHAWVSQQLTHWRRTSKDRYRAALSAARGDERGRSTSWRTVRKDLDFLRRKLSAGPAQENLDSAMHELLRGYRPFFQLVEGGRPFSHRLEAINWLRTLVPA